MQIREILNPEAGLYFQTEGAVGGLATGAIVEPPVVITESPTGPEKDKINQPVDTTEPEGSAPKKPKIYEPGMRMGPAPITHPGLIGRGRGTQGDLTDRFISARRHLLKNSK